MKKKYLFISNSNIPNDDLYYSKEDIKLGNVRKPSVEAAIQLGYDVIIGVNRFYAEEIKATGYPNVRFYNQNIYRNLFDFKNNYIAYKNLVKVLKEENIDVLHCNTPIGGLLGRIAGWACKTDTIIYTAHGFHFYEGGNFFKNLIFKNVEKILSRFTDAIITMNNEDYLAAKNFKMKRIDSVYFIPGVGIDIEKFEVDTRVDSIRKELNLTEEDFIVVSVGDLIKRKNYNAVIRAMKEIDNKEIKYLICGTGPEEKALKNLVKENDLVDQVIFLGYRTDVNYLLSECDLFVLSSYQEGLPRSLMEAMAAGLPCVVSNIRGNIDLIHDGHNGYLIDANDAEGYAKAIKEISTSKEIQQEMSMLNSKLIKQYSSENVEKVMLNIHKRILGKEDLDE